MNSKRWAIFFLNLLVLNETFAFIQRPLPPLLDNSLPELAPKPSVKLPSPLLPSLNSTRAKRQTGCRVDCDRVTVIVDETLERCRSRIQDRYPLRDDVAGEFQLASGFAEGFQKFERVGSLECSCNKRVLIFFCEICYLNIVVSYTVTLLEDVLGSLLGNLGRSLSRLLGGVVNLLLRILVLEIRVTLKVTQRLYSGSKCVLNEYKVTRVNGLSVLNLDLSSVAQSLEEVLAPVLDVVLKLVANQELRQVFQEEFSRTSIPIDVVTF